MSAKALDNQMSDAILDTGAAPDQLELIEEFSIMELEERLEFEAWCNFGCDNCPTNPGCEGV